MARTNWTWRFVLLLAAVSPACPSSGNPALGRDDSSVARSDAALQGSSGSPHDVTNGSKADVQELITKWSKLNDRCRGGSGDDPATWRACSERDVLFKQIQTRGYCWGAEGQIEADKTWQKCPRH